MSYILKTERLVLRPFELSDAARVQQLANVKELAATTFLPHPYTLEIAENWINTYSELIEQKKAFPLAIVLESKKLLIGYITLGVKKIHNKGEMAYWIGKEYWGQGYATEAVKQMIEFGFNELNLNRLEAPVMKKNVASGKVMKKVGMIYEGTLKQLVLRWDNYEDVEMYGLTKEDYNSLLNYHGRMMFFSHFLWCRIYFVMHGWLKGALVEYDIL